MRVMTILGSPRLAGHTATVLGRFEELIAAEHLVERVNLVERRIGGCLGCNACQGAVDRPGCIQQDDGPAVLAGIVAADAVVYATPLYAWGFSAQMKALIDRHYCLVNTQDASQYTSLVEAKPTTLLVTCGGPDAGNADLIRETFMRIAAYSQSRVIGIYVVPFCTNPDALGPAAENTAREMFRDFTDRVVLHDG
jgi:multimeric flavodoxin WrbA